MLDPEFESVSDGEPAPIRWIHRRSESLAADHGWHFHPQYELTWFIASTGTRYVADGVERYAAGDLVLSGPNIPHCWRNDADAPAEWMSVQFPPAFAGDGMLDLPEAAAVRALLDAARGGIAFTGGTPATTGRLIAAMGEADGFVRLLRLLEVLHLLSRVAYRPLASSGYHGRTVVDQQMVRRLDRITRYVNEHFRGAVSQADLADELEMTPAAFSKFVRAATGGTFSDMVRRARINEACRLLAHEDARVTAIALECGYQHTSHFDHQFRAMRGVTPSEYRRVARTLGGGDAENARKPHGK